jgi:hypothetical protein
MHKAFQAQDHVLNKLNQWFAHIVDIEFRGVLELALDSINISLGKWTLTLSSKDDLHSTANKLPKYFHRLYRCYKVSPSCKESARKSGIYHSPPYWLYVGEKHFHVERCDCWQAKRRLKMQLNLWLKDT